MDMPVNPPHHTHHDFGPDVSVERMPAHWLMARLGKRVLRPGGIEATEWMLEQLHITRDDEVVELAPGLGVTARKILAHHPRDYSAVEQEPAAAEYTRHALAKAGYPGARILSGDANEMPLQDDIASVVAGEAMLSMQHLNKKREIFSEVRRVLHARGRYGIHELAIAPEQLPPEQLQEIERDLSRAIHVGVRIGLVSDWKAWLEEAGFEVVAHKLFPMRLLETERLIRDEGLLGFTKFATRAARTPGAVKRLLEVRSVFRKHEAHLKGIAIIARKKG